MEDRLFDAWRGPTQAGLLMRANPDALIAGWQPVESRPLGGSASREAQVMGREPLCQIDSLRLRVCPITGSNMRLHSPRLK